MKPIIVIIDDNTMEINQIKSLFPSGYDFYPENQDNDNSFLNNVRGSIDNTFQLKDESRAKVKETLKELSNNIIAFILDYKLKPGDNRIEIITGLKFYEDIIFYEYPKIPCMILTGLKKKPDLNKILDYVDKINDRKKLTIRFKELNDIYFQNSIKDFVKQANPILQLVKEAQSKPIRGFKEELKDILKNIEKEYEKYDYSIIKILNEFVDYTAQIDNKIQLDFIDKFKNAKLIKDE